MYVKNVLRAGQYAQFIPMGMPVTLEYNENGILLRAYEGYEGKKRIPEVVEDAIYDSGLVPNLISLRGGTTWVKAIFYTEEQVLFTGRYPDDLYEGYYKMFVNSYDKFKGYGLCVESTVANINGAVSQRTTLEANGFQTIVGFLVPPDLNYKTFEKLAEDRFQFRFPMIAWYLVYEGTTPYFINTGLESKMVQRVNKTTDINGYIHGNLAFSDGDSLLVDYNQIVHYQITTNTHVILDMNRRIIYSESTDDKVREKRSSVIKCTVCGSKILVSDDEPTICPNTHCLSRLYTDIAHMLNAFRLPVLTEKEYSSKVNKKMITCMSDIFLLENYKDSRIRVGLGQFLDAIVPIPAVRNRQIFVLFANKCANNLQTFRYYLENPHLFDNDLDLRSHSAVELQKWLEDPENLLTVQSMLDLDNIILQVTDKLYEGAPILLNKRVYITGEFFHGPQSKIISIVQTYSGVATTYYDDSVDMILVGGKRENVNGHAIHKGKIRNIPVYEEQQFFDMYGIDQDLRENLQ